MPVYGIKSIESVEVKNANGDVVFRFEYPSQKLTNQEKLNPKNIKKVIFNPPATIVIFKDDTKIVAKAYNEEFDEEKGFLMCMSKLMFESRSEFNRLIDKSIEESYK